MKKRMAQVIDGRAMSVGEILGGAAQDSKGAQLKFKKVKDSSSSF
jgi:C-terminal processing protease CtpA/Prc